MATRWEVTTLALIVVASGGWMGAAWLHPSIGIPLMAVATALHSSLQHEALHGHPTRNALVNEALVTWPLGVLIPYRRFRDTHLAHHRNEALTDPYDDPESHYFDPAVWSRLPYLAKMALRANNTLAGRLVLGPAIGGLAFLRGEARLLASGAPGVRLAWAIHAAALMPVLAWLAASPMPGWAAVLAIYAGHALLKIRTFLEHRAHDDPGARSAIVEGGGPLAWLFLNNNLHALHHAHPKVAWYRLPALYRARRAQVLRRNGGYAYRGYGEVFRRHLWRAKDPVPHPLMREPEG